MLEKLGYTCIVHLEGIIFLIITVGVMVGRFVLVDSCLVRKYPVGLMFFL